jgi:hypothetical protein
MLNTIGEAKLQGMWSELGTLWYSHVVLAGISPKCICSFMSKLDLLCSGFLQSDHHDALCIRHCQLRERSGKRFGHSSRDYCIWELQVEVHPCPRCSSGWLPTSVFIASC